MQRLRSLWLYSEIALVTSLVLIVSVQAEVDTSTKLNAHENDNQPLLILKANTPQKNTPTLQAFKDEENQLQEKSISRSSTSDASIPLASIAQRDSLLDKQLASDSKKPVRAYVWESEQILSRIHQVEEGEAGSAVKARPNLQLEEEGLFQTGERPQQRQQTVAGESLRRLLVEEHEKKRRMTKRKPQREGRDMKGSKGDVNGWKVSHIADIPDVSLATTNDFFDGRSRRKLVEGSSQSAAAPSKPLFTMSSSQILAEQAKVQTQLNSHSHSGNQHSNRLSRRILQTHSTGNRNLVGERPNGISELPDPEAAEYLANHQSQDLGKNVITAAELHYNGTQQSEVHPLNTDRHATTEEHITQGLNQASLDDHLQHSEAVSARYNFQEDLETYEQPAAQSNAGNNVVQASGVSKQEGYPWYAHYPPPSFPDASITKTNLSVHTDLIFNLKTLRELERKEEEAELAANANRAQKMHEQASNLGNVAQLTRENIAAEASSKATVNIRIQPKGPGDGGEVPKSTIFGASGNGIAVSKTTARAAKEQLDWERSQAQLWMSSQEASLIESHLSPEDAMLEFGAGYMTMWFSRFVNSYYSVEHNATWFNEIKDQITSTRENVHLQVAPVEKGYKGWGGGFEEGTYQQFEHYIKSVDNFKVNRFDKVLIDGRARASCAEYVLKFLNQNSLVFIHDYQDRYFYHGTAEQYYIKVAETFDGQSLIILRPKAEALKKLAQKAVASLASS